MKASHKKTVTGDKSITKPRQAEEGARIFQALADNAGEAIAISDLEGNMIYSNRAAYELLGYDYEKRELDGAPMDTFASAQDRARQVEALGHIMSTGGKFSTEATAIRKDGSTRDIAVTMFPIFNEQNQPTNIGAILRDITERKQAETLVRQAEERQRQILEVSPVAMAITRIADGKVLYANHQTGLLLKRDMSRIVGDSALIIYADPAERQKMMELIRQQGSLRDHEVQCIHPDDKHLFWLMVSVEIIEYGGEKCFLSSLADITERKQIDAALRESEERFRALYDNATVGLYRTTPDGRLLMINPAGIRMMGYDSFDEIAKLDVENAGYAQEGARSEFREKIEREGYVVGLENEWKRKDGSTIYIRESARAICDENGKVLYYDGSFEDITERKQAEEALRESEARYSAVVNQANDGVIIIQDNIAQFVNKVLADMLGYNTPEEMQGTPFINFVAPESRVLIANRVKARLAGEDVQSVYEAKLQRKDGTAIDAELSAGVIQYHGKSADVGIIRDITERKQVEQELHRNLSILENSPDFIGMASMDGKGLYCNPAGLAMTGYTADEFYTSLKIGDFQPDLPAEAMNTVMQLGMWQGEASLTCKDGHNIPVSQVITIVKDDAGNPHFLTTIARDITERKQAEVALQESEERFRRFSDVTAEGLVFHEQGRIVDANAALATMFGYSDASEFLGKNLMDFIAPEARAEVVKQLQSGSTLPYEAVAVRKDGSTFPVEAAGRLYEYQGRTIRVGSIRDITERKQAEEELRLKDSALASSVNAVMINNPQGKTLYVNDAFCKLWGYTQEEAMQLSPFDLNYNPEDTPKIIQILQTQGSFIGEAPAKHKDGHPFPVQISASIITNPEGQPIAMMASWVDVTERKQAEILLQQSEANLLSSLRVAHMGHWDFDVPTQMFTFNDQYYSLHGTTAQKAGGYQMSAQRFAQEYVYPEDAGTVGHTIQQAIVATDPNFQLQTEARIMHADGKPRWVTVWFRIEKDAQGQTVKLHGLNQDITERKLAEVLLQQSEANLLSSLRVAHMGHWDFDVPTQTFTFNDQYYSLHGTTAQKAGGYQMSAQRFAQEYVYPEDAGTVGHTIQQAIVATDPNFQLQTEARIMHADGKPRWVTVWFRIEKDAQGQTVKMHGLNQDITERKQTEAERERLLTMLDNSGDLIGMIDLKTNLTVYLNPAGIRMTGLDSLDQAMGQPITFYHSPEAIKFMEEQVMPVVFSKGFWRGENHLLRIDGSQIPIDQTLFVIKDNAGQPQYIATFITDITERKRAEELLRQSEADLLSSLRVAHMGHWDFDVPTQMFTFNDQYYSLHGTTAQQVGGYQMSAQRFAQEYVYSEDAGTVGHTIQQAIEATDPNFQIQTEARIMHSDGKPRWVMVWFRIEKDAQGQTVKMHGLNQDITERKRLEGEIQQALERRGYQVQVSTEISQEVAAAPELSDIFARVVMLTKERLGYYHTQLLRYDPAQDAVVLINGYGETGQKMLAEGHKLPMGSGLIGTAAASGQTVMRSTLAEDPDWQPNPLLPNTKGEIAVPIKWQDAVLGVLDVQSDQADALTEDDRLLLEGLCGQVAVAMEQTRLRQEMAERLEEVNRLYRTMSYEGWKAYREATNLPAGFVYDQAGIKPVDEAISVDESFANIPMRVLGGEIVGSLAVANDPRHPTTTEDQVFLQQVSDQIALALESARLFEQTQSALAQTERLSEAGLRFARAADLQELAAAVLATINIPVVNRAVLVTFNYDEKGTLNYLDTVANWWNGSGHEAAPIGTRLSREILHIMPMFISPTPIFFDDVQNDEHMDAGSLELAKRSHLHAVAILPLYSGTHQIGAFILEAEEHHNFTQDEIRLFSALAPQISTVVENRRQFERAQKQAERESMLNLISQKIQSATTVEAVLQIAARELGHALGAPMTIAQLSMKEKK